MVHPSRSRHRGLRACLAVACALALASSALADDAPAPAPSFEDDAPDAPLGLLAPAPSFGRVVINEIMYNELKKPEKPSKLSGPKPTKRANLRRASARAEAAPSDLAARKDEATTNKRSQALKRAGESLRAADAPDASPDDASMDLQTDTERAFPKGGDWIELHNPTDVRVDIAGWTLRGSRVRDKGADSEDDGSFVVSAAVVDPFGYLVLARNVETFARRYPKMARGSTGTRAGPPVVLDASFDFNLSAKGEMISLYDASGRLVDFVEYDNGDGWPAAADGEGSSLELINPVKLDRNDPLSWVASEVVGGTPGKENGAFIDE
jgi:hypothetical protein